MEKEINIGEIIRKMIEENKIDIVEFAGLIGLDDRNIHRIYYRKDFQPSS